MNLRNSHAGTSIVVEWFCNWVSSGVEWKATKMKAGNESMFADHSWTGWRLR